MPYINAERKKFLEDHDPESVGDLNYLITKLLLKYLNARSVSYKTLNDIIGVLECAKLEFTDRIIRDFEDLKMRVNEDVYEGASSNTNLAWAGGFFEGEGCFYAHWYKPRLDGSKTFRVSASLTQKDRGLLEEFKNVVKCGVVYNDGGRIYVWKTSHIGEPKKVFDLLRPWLGERRQTKFKALYEKEQKQIFRPKKLKCGNNHKYIEGSYIMREYRDGAKYRLCLKCRKINNNRKRAREIEKMESNGDVFTES